MGKETVRRLPLKYLMAAAALLIALVGVVPAYYYYAGSGEVKKMAIEKITAPRVIPAIPEQPVALPVNDQQKIAVKGSGTKNLSREHERRMPEAPEEGDVMMARQPENTVIANSPSPIIATPAPTLITKTEMKEVHINEVDGVTPAPKPALASRELVVDFRTMPVVHINDLVKEAFEVKAILKENRMTFGHNLFSRPVYYNNYPDAGKEEYGEPHHILKSIFNTQN